MVRQAEAITIWTRMLDWLPSYKPKKIQELGRQAARAPTEEKAIPTTEVVVWAWVRTKAKLRLTDSSRRAMINSSFLRVMRRRKGASVAYWVNLVGRIRLRSRGMVVDMADSLSTVSRVAMGDILSKEAIRLSRGMVDTPNKAATVVDTSRLLPRRQAWVPLVVQHWGWVEVSLGVLFWVALLKVGMGAVTGEVMTTEVETTVEEAATKVRECSDRFHRIASYDD